MIVLITDPITNNLVTNPKNHPFVIEGTERNLTKIYFESQATREAYLKNSDLRAMFS